MGEDPNKGRYGGPHILISFIQIVDERLKLLSLNVILLLVVFLGCPIVVLEIFVLLRAQRQQSKHRRFPNTIASGPRHLIDQIYHHHVV